MKEYGIVLAGGGAKGGYEIGVWKALRELEIPIKAIAGTSVGALNGAIMVQGDYNIALELWSNMQIQDVIDLENISIQNDNTLTPKETIKVVKNTINNGGLDVTPLKNMLEKYIDEDKIRQSPIDFGLVTFSITDIKPIMIYKDEIPEGQLIDYLLASSCFPVFKPQKIDDKKFIDGGIYDNIPISLIANKNIKDIIVVDISESGKIKKLPYDDLNITYIKSSGDLGGVLDFNGDTSKINIKMGYLDTLKIYKKIYGKNYYISSYKSKILKPLNDEEITRIVEILDLNDDISSSHNLKNLILLKTIRKYTNSKLNNSNTILAALEITAEILEIERLKIYTDESLLKEILNAYNEIKSTEYFKVNIENITKLIKNKDKSDLNYKDIKYVVCSDTSLVNDNSKINVLRRVTSITYPNICIANIFLSLVLERINSENF